MIGRCLLYTITVFYLGAGHAQLMAKTSKGQKAVKILFN